MQTQLGGQEKHLWVRVVRRLSSCSLRRASVAFCSASSKAERLDGGASGGPDRPAEAETVKNHSSTLQQSLRSGMDDRANFANLADVFVSLARPALSFIVYIST